MISIYKKNLNQLHLSRFLVSFGTCYPSPESFSLKLPEAWTVSGRPSFVVGFPSWTANEIWIALHIASIHSASKDAELLCFCFTKKNAEICWNTTEMRSCISNVGSCQIYSKLSPKESTQTSSVWFHLKQSNEKHRNEHLCDPAWRAKKRKVCGWMICWLLGSAVSKSATLTTSSHFSHIMLEVSKYVIVSNYSEWQVSKIGIWILPFSANKRKT